MEWYLKVLQDNYANFSGRARRKEFWMFNLFNALFVVLFYAILLIGIANDSDAIMMIGGILLGLYVLAIFIPSLAVAVRRLHDTNKSGWLILIRFIPFGGLVLLVFYCIEGDKGVNQYGSDPKNLSLEMEDNLLENEI